MESQLPRKVAAGLLSIDTSSCFGLPAVNTNFHPKVSGISAFTDPLHDYRHDRGLGLKSSAGPQISRVFICRLGRGAAIARAMSSQNMEQQRMRGMLLGFGQIRRPGGMYWIYS